MLTFSTMPKCSLKKMIAKNRRFDECSNPHNLSNHGKKRLAPVRKITERLLREWKLSVNDETLGMMICNSCRTRMLKPSTSNENENKGLQNQEVILILMIT